MTENNVEMELFIVQKKLEELKIKVPTMCPDHLKACLQQAQDKGDQKATCAIVQILRREADSKRWRRITRSMGKPPAGQVLSVKVDREGETLEYDTEEGAFVEVKKNLSERFRLTFTAPSCSGALFDNIGFLGDTESVQQI